VDEADRRIRRSWWLLAGAFVGLGLLVVLRLTTSGAGPLDWLTAALILVAGGAALVHRNAVASLEAGRRAEAESFARILSGLSRSVSPDAVVGTIVEELADSTGADHVVVVRRRPDAPVLDATLVSSRPGVPNSSTVLPISALEDPLEGDDGPRARRRPDEPVAIPIETGIGVVAGVPTEGMPEPRVHSSPWPSGPRSAQVRAAIEDPGVVSTDPVEAAPMMPAASTTAALLVAERIADRVRSAYGLRDTIAAPLAPGGQVVGAIVLSRRVADPWPATARRLLDGAAREASMALSRAYSHRAAEARATTDALTGLPNRRYFEEFCGLLARRRRADDAVGVLMVDIDRFKMLNDTYGHAMGDEVLRAVGSAIVSAVREDDVPARYGGEEFVVLLRNPSRTVAVDVGERVREAVAALDLAPFGVPSVSVSVGVAVAEVPDQPIPELVRAADAALYRAKRAGRDRVVAA
jgi:diguanylate cyclase (GGDEF)-like protein